MILNKNIHLLSTDKPSKKGDIVIWNGLKIWNGIGEPPHHNQNIYITSDEKIKEGDWMIRANEQPIKVIKGFFWDFGVRYYKIILTTDQDLIKDGVQAIDDEFLEWFAKNPSCEEIVVVKKSYGICNSKDDKCYCYSQIDEHNCLNFIREYKIIIPKEEPKQELERGITITHVGKQETLEEETLAKIKFVLSCNNDAQAIRLLEQYGQWQQERSYSEEDIRNAIDYGAELGLSDDIGNSFEWTRKKDLWFEQFKKK